ncbi:unnamed protein product [Prunus armeniaca]|uniref:Uncharacterized protein n=1 Tax=Prunus armeniaca TaxID=36596 RepID=A0A6J5UIL9_PRUAR|nr:unnamed protein product [Prunus armeniaca]
MISMVNHDKIPLGDILYNAILGKTIGHGTKHKGTLVFPCLIQRLCEKNGVAFLDSDQWHPPIGPYGKASAALSQRVSRTFLTSVSSSSENASLRAQLAAKEEYIQHLLTLIPSTSIPAPPAAAAAADPQSAPATDEDSDDSVDSGEVFCNLIGELFCPILNNWYLTSHNSMVPSLHHLLSLGFGLSVLRECVAKESQKGGDC